MSVRKQAEADTRIAPATIPGAISGSVTRLNVSSGPVRAFGRRSVGVDETTVETDHDLLRYIALETNPSETVAVEEGETTSDRQSRWNSAVDRRKKASDQVSARYVS